MRLLALSLVLATVATATAQSAPVSPAVRTVRGALALRARIESSGETSCSQSFATSRHTIDLALDVTASDHATLRVESHGDETFGEASARFTGGSATRTQTLARRVLSGRATRTGSTLTIRFDHADDAQATWRGDGVGALDDASTRSAVSLSMTCRLVETPVLPATPPPPAYPATPETSEATTLLRCAFATPPQFVAYDETNEWLFGAGRGVRTLSRRDAFTPEGTLAVRRFE